MTETKYERDKQIYADWIAGAKIHEMSDYWGLTTIHIYNIIRITKKRYRTGYFKTEKSEQMEINRKRKVSN